MDAAPAPEERSELAALVAGLAAEVARRAARGAPRVARGSAGVGAASFMDVAPGKAAAAAPASPAAPPSPKDADAGAGEREILVPAAPRVPDALPAVLEPAAAEQNRARANACATLGELRSLVAGCTACGLARTRTQTVFSDGRDGARLLFIGEAPGQHEDEQGVPFVGAAGQLLTDIIQKGMGLARADVYIANVLKCRPPGNRDPSDDEKALCTPYLDRQIELLDPQLIVTLGLHATRHLLRSPLSMARLRGKVHLWNGRKVIATYHPAYLLRNPADKKECWKDIQLAMRELGLTPPGAARGPAAPA